MPTNMRNTVIGVTALFVLTCIGVVLFLEFSEPAAVRAAGAEPLAEHSARQSLDADDSQGAVQAPMDVGLDAKEPDVSEGESRVAAGGAFGGDALAKKYEGFTEEQLAYVKEGLEKKLVAEATKVFNELFERGAYETVIKPAGEGVSQENSFPDGTPRLTSTRGTTRPDGTIEYHLAAISPFDDPRLASLYGEIAWLSKGRQH